MTPSFTIFNSIYCANMDTKISCNFSLAPLVIFNRNDFFYSKVFSRMITCTSAFFYTIIHVILGSSNKKVVWTTASRVIAFMKNIFTFGDRSISKFVCDSVDIFIITRIFAGWHTHDSIAVRCFVPSPNPAGICFDNPFPESFVQWLWWKSGHNTVPPEKYDYIKGLDSQ